MTSTDTIKVYTVEPFIADRHGGSHVIHAHKYFRTKDKSDEVAVIIELARDDVQFMLSAAKFVRDTPYAMTVEFEYGGAATVYAVSSTDRTTQTSPRREQWNVKAYVFGSKAVAFQVYSMDVKIEFPAYLTKEGIKTYERQS